jgi:hypothetical protein
MSPVRDHILQDFNTLYPTRFRTHKIARPPPNKKPRMGGGLTDKHLPRSPFTGKFFRWRQFALMSILLGAHKLRARRTVCKSVFFSKDINC